MMPIDTRLALEAGEDLRSTRLAVEGEPDDSHARDATNGRTPPDAGEAAHAVQFYEDDDFLHRTVAEFLTTGSHTARSIVVFATPAHRRGIRSRLAAMGIADAHTDGTGLVSWLDARETLSSFMTGSGPDRLRFQRIVRDLLEPSDRPRSRGEIRVFGEMVDLLYRDGRQRDALRLEELWNQVLAGSEERISLLCGYAIGSFPGDEHADLFREICGRHGHVAPSESFLRTAGRDERNREIARLQQRERSLEAEIERRKRTEEMLRRARKEAEHASRAKTDFLAVMSHELRTPLNAILGYDDLLEQELVGPLNSEQKEFLGRIRTCAGQLRNLIDRVLDLSHLQTGSGEPRLESIDLGELAGETVALMGGEAADPGLDLRVEAPSEPLRVRSDGGKVRQILLNLLSNAIKFTERGEVRVTVGRSEGEYAVVSVEDDGPGIPLADLQRIFEPFEQGDGSPTRKHGGTGLGLSLSQETARLLGGDLGVISRRGAGSTFTLHLPLTRDGGHHRPACCGAAPSGEASSRSEPSDLPTEPTAFSIR